MFKFHNFIKPPLKGALALLSMLAVMMVNSGALSQSPPDPSTLIVRDIQNNYVIEYENSYALLFVASHYTNGWKPLKDNVEEVNKLYLALKEQGFSAKVVANPTRKVFFEEIDNFIAKYGYKKNNRILVYFSGHGFTRPTVDQGYLVMVDATDPNRDLGTFLSRSVTMAEMETWAKKMEVQHAIFIFDSCFSGTIFETRSPIRIAEPKLSKASGGPVRQFITAGGANEEVPARSQFTPLLIRMIEGDADLNQDGYVTGTELGYKLQDVVPDYANHTPQYGKIRDTRFDEGDFIFSYKPAIDSIPSISQPSTGFSFDKGNDQPATTAGGMLLDVLLGSQVGQSLDRADQAYATKAADRAFSAPIGEPTRWMNPQSGNSGVVTPIRQGRTATGKYCREFAQTIYYGGRTEQGKGIACQEADGTWKIVQ